MKRSHEQVTLNGWQWGEILLGAVLVWAVIAVQVLTSSTTAVVVLCTVQLVLLVHVAVWFIPLIRARHEAP
jgi:O-antigen ligase